MCLSQVNFDDLLPNQPRGGTGDVFYKSIRVITSTGEQSFSQGDIVKLDTKPIIYGRVLYFVQANKKNDFDKVVVMRQPDEVCVLLVAWEIDGISYELER
jgi:hypothetical protein